MNLYHYGQAGYKVLKTLQAQRTITSAEKKQALEKKAKRYNVDPGLYYEHISFLFDPIEPDHYKYFNKNHPVWKKGTTLTEYVVDTSQMGEFKWMIVEVPEVCDARLDDSVTEQQFWDIYVEVMTQKYIGSGERSLQKAAKQFVGHQKDYLKIASKLNPDSMRYAADVPHVMVYPKDGMVLFESSRTVVLG